MKNPEYSSLHPFEHTTGVHDEKGSVLIKPQDVYAGRDHPPLQIRMLPSEGAPFRAEYHTLKGQS